MVCRGKIFDMNNTLERAAFTLIGAVILLVFVIGLFALGSDTTSVPSSDARYEYVVIDGVPCLQINSAVVTCDWDSWQGTVDGDKAVLP